MEDNTAKINRVLANLKERHKQMDNLMAFTREMGKVIDINDLESLGAVLSMRQKSMEKIDQLHSDMLKTVKSLDIPQRDKVIRILEQKAEPAEFDDVMEAEIFNVNRMSMALLRKIVALDGEINERLRKKEG